MPIEVNIIHFMTLTFVGFRFIQEQNKNDQLVTFYLNFSSISANS